MKIQIREFAGLTGVSVRTLHYYDEIGLLKPAAVDEHTGYRYYDEESLLRMQQILFYRELDFSLKSILEMLSSPHYDQERALMEQKKLLTLKKERLERLISAIDGATKGENVMQAFDNSNFEQYKGEVREKWGKTAAYKEHKEKTKQYSREQWSDLGERMNEIFARFAVCKNQGAEPGSAEVQELARMLQNYITEHFYVCTVEILAGLGQMYVADERFRDTIDRAGTGTAEFISKAIEIYCEKA